jgi:hypothetical protein
MENTQEHIVARILQPAATSVALDPEREESLKIVLSFSFIVKPTPSAHPAALHERTSLSK